MKYFVLLDREGKQLHNGDLLVHNRNRQSYKLLGFVVPEQKVIVREVGAMGGSVEISIRSFGCKIEERNNTSVL